MKANELMVGDWMYNRVADITFQVYPQFFSQWHNRPEQFESIIQPIPLTAEILEKNGFVRDGESWWYKDFRIVLSTSNGISLVCGRQMRFKYVHQLQHAIHLCGIEKEITL